MINHIKKFHVYIFESISDIVNTTVLIKNFKEIIVL